MNDLINDKNIFKCLLWFSIPILLGNLFQQLYNIVDTVVIGHTLGDNALAAVGSVGTLYALFIYFVSGMATGFSIIASKLYGQGNEKDLRKAVGLSIVYGVVISILMTILALIFIKPILNILNTPSEIYSDCLSYIRFVLLFLVITMIYNLESATLRALGDSKTPLIFLIISSLLNVVLDYSIIVYGHTGVIGAAIATIISQFISTILCMIHIKKNFPILNLSKDDFIFDKQLSKDLLSIGVTMGFSSSIVSIGSLILQSSINQLGTTIITAHSAARKIDELMMLPLISFGLALSTFISQNIGATKYERLKQGNKVMVEISFIWSIICIVVVFAFSKTLITLISGTSSTEIINLASQYLKVNVPFFFFLSLLFIYKNALQGMEKKTIPMISSIIEFLGKILTILILTPALGYFGIMISEPIVWIICAIVCVIDYRLEYKKLMFKRA